MSAADQRAPRARRGRVIVAVLVALVAIAAGLWVSRVPIARGLIGRELTKAGVPARYEIADLGFGRQRLTDVVVGDPAKPDLVADWIETHTDLSTAGARLVAVRAGHVRVRARWVDGRLSLGAIDRLLPKSQGGGFTLPQIDVEAQDARVRLETPWGMVGAVLRGKGRLDDGFAGRLALVADRIAMPDCAAGRLSGAFTLRSTGADGLGGHGLKLSGPINAGQVACNGARLATLAGEIDGNVVLGASRGSSLNARLTSGAVMHPLLRADAARGDLSFVHTGPGGVNVSGTLAMVAARGARMRAGVLTVEGAVERRPGYTGFGGKVRVADADASARVPGFAGTAAGTPLAPLIDRASGAVRAAARRFSGEANLRVVATDEVGIWIRRASLASASGVRASAANPDDLLSALQWHSDTGLLLNGELRVAGGGAPTLVATAVQRRASAPRQITVAMAPYAAGGARLAMTPVSIDQRGTAIRATTRASVSGPLADGHVDGAIMPLDVRWSGGAITINPACTPLSVERIATGGLVLRGTRVRLCPVAAALVRVADGRMTGGASIAAPRLAGTIGGTPLLVTAQRARIGLADGGIAVEDLRTRLGAPGRVTRLDVAQIEGRAGAPGVAGRFAGAAGQIANVPLLLADATGTWRLRDGRLDLDGGLRVSDADAQPRFQPLDARSVALRLADGRIEATGTLVEPTRGVKVADVAIRHALGSGVGDARLDVPGLAFGDGFQPELLTRLTFGVIADVRGRVAGRGDIAWSPAGVKSNGAFSTAGTDLAAAFGPVEGIAGTIRFTDLLALESAPDQVATVKSINPGVPVTDGRIVYQTLSGARIRVGEGRWPFAGGTLTLAPTLLDFSSPQVRRMTFDVRGMDAARFLQQFDFKNLNATGVFDGTLPMLFDADGGRIAGGSLVARAGGGGIAYVGELTDKQLGFWGDFAFQALRSLTYRTLEVQMNGPLAGELVTAVRFAGIRQGEGAKSNFLLRRLTRLPIIFNIRIKAPFRGLIDSTASFYDPSRLVTRNLQQLIDAQNEAVTNRAAPPTTTPPIQPPASENVP